MWCLEYFKGMERGFGKNQIAVLRYLSFAVGVKILGREKDCLITYNHLYQRETKLVCIFVCFLKLNSSCATEAVSEELLLASLSLNL